MKREELKAIFADATDEQIKAVMDINGADIEGFKSKIAKLNTEIEEKKNEISKITADFDVLKNSKASAEEWEKKYNDLVEENKAKAEEKERLELEAQERAEFDNYFAENNKEWANPLIADGYFGKFKEAKTLPENKGKTTGDIAHSLTKDDATAFKTTQPVVTLKGATGGLSGNAYSAEQIRNMSAQQINENWADISNSLKNIN